MAENPHWLLAAGVLAVLLGAGCADTDETHGGERTDTGATAFVSVAEAVEAPAGEHLRLAADLVIDEDGTARVCDYVGESYPPVCDKMTNMVLTGIEDPEALDIEHARGVYWGGIEARLAKQNDRLELIELISTRP